MEEVAGWVWEWWPRILLYAFMFDVACWLLIGFILTRSKRG